MAPFNTIKEAIADIKQGKMIIVTDDCQRENEGDLVMAAEKITHEAVNFMATHGRGLICVPITEERRKKLDIPLMTSENDSEFKTAFGISVDSKKGGTGISAMDRARTIKALVDKATSPSDLMRPGHIFPLVANSKGVLKRAGHTEAAVDMATLSGFKPVGVICEICNEDGSMARLPELFKMAKKFSLKIITIEDIIEYRQQNEILITEESSIEFPSRYGMFNLHLFKGMIDLKQHIALVKGDLKGTVLTRVHSECLTGDLLGSLRCDCGEQLQKSLELIEKEGGILLYLRQEGRGIGLANKIKAYHLQDQGLDTVSANHQLGLQADLRDYYIAGQILQHFNIKKINLVTNNPRKLNDLQKFGIDVIKRIPLEIDPNSTNRDYLLAKRDRLGHILNLKTENNEVEDEHH